MADVSVTGDAWLDGVLGFNTAQDAGTTVTAQTVPTNVIQGTSSTRSTGGSFTDFFYAGLNKVADYQLKKDQAKTQAELALTMAQANALNKGSGMTLSPAVMAAAIVGLVVVVMALRK